MQAYITSNAHSLAIRLENGSALYLDELEVAQHRNAQLVVAAAQQLSQTQFFTLGELKRLKHPYRPGSAPPTLPYIVNRQSGDVFSRWRSQVRRTADAIQAIIFNTSPHAKYLRGTKWMIERPILEEAVRRTQLERQRNLQAARARGARAARSAGGFANASDRIFSR